MNIQLYASSASEKSWLLELLNFLSLSSTSKSELIYNFCLIKFLKWVNWIWVCLWWCNPIVWDVVEPRSCLQDEPTWWSYVHLTLTDLTEAKIFILILYLYFIIDAFCFAIHYMDEFHYTLNLLLSCSWSEKLKYSCVVISFISCFTHELGVK